MNRGPKARAHGDQVQFIRQNFSFALAILLALVLVEFWGGYQLCKRHIWARFIKVQSLQSLRIKSIPMNAYVQKKISQQPMSRSGDPMAQSIDALHWTMNQVQKIGYNPRGNEPAALLKSVEMGAGALCDDMADLYQNVLAAMGKPARKIWLYRDLFGGDTHSTVEVKVNGKWLLLDPTFGISFQNAEKQPLSAQDLKQELYSGKYREVRPVFYGEVSYPARFETYYMNPLLLYNNVFVVERAPGWLRQIPILCYWFGTRLYYEKLPHEPETQIQFIRQLFFIFAVILPVFILVAGFMVLFYRSRLARLSKKNS